MRSIKNKMDYREAMQEYKRLSGSNRPEDRRRMSDLHKWMRKVEAFGMLVDDYKEEASGYLTEEV